MFVCPLFHLLRADRLRLDWLVHDVHTRSQRSGRQSSSDVAVDGRPKR